MITHDARRSLSRGNNPVPSRWLATIGSPSNEVLRGHPLWGSGLELYSAHEVENSPWITELMEVGRAHERFDESLWSGRRHFLLTFHDETLECVAKWTASRTAPGATMPEVIARLTAEAL